MERGSREREEEAEAGAEREWSEHREGSERLALPAASNSTKQQLAPNAQTQIVNSA